MTIARGTSSGQESGDAGPRRIFDGRVPQSELLDTNSVPAGIRADRLTRQIENFVRAGYLLESRCAFQAVVLKVRDRPAAVRVLLAVATFGLAVLLAPSAARRSSHRVVVTVDPTGAVRFV